MIKIYKLDKVACLKHIATEEEVSTSYRSKSEEVRGTAAKSKAHPRQVAKTFPDKNARFGPPDRSGNINPKQKASKRCHENEQDLDTISPVKRHCQASVDNSIIKGIPNRYPDAVGKKG